MKLTLRFDTWCTMEGNGREQLMRTSSKCTAVRHGTLSAYTNDGCRCQQARDEHAAYQRDYRQRRMALTGERMVNGRFVNTEGERS